MTKAKKPAIVFLLLSWASLACGQATKTSEAYAPSVLKVIAPDVFIERVRIRGKGFDWDHEIQVALPPSYRKSNKDYPVLWVTDGLINFDFAVEIVNGPMKKYWPEMIVVGIGVPREESPEFQARRVYEFTPNDSFGFDGPGGNLLPKRYAAQDAPHGSGGIPKFLEFLVDELRPMLSQKYRMAAKHILFGSSGGGSFCTYAFLTHPSTFNGYICLSPALNENNLELFKLEERYSAAHSDLPAKVYFAAGEGEVMQGGLISALGVVSSMTRMAEILTVRQYPSLKLWAHIFPGEEHGSFKPAGLAHGLRAIWADDLDGTRKH